MKVNIYTDANVSKFSIVSHCSLEEQDLSVFLCLSLLLIVRPISVCLLVFAIAIHSLVSERNRYIIMCS